MKSKGALIVPCSASDTNRIVASLLATGKGAWNKDGDLIAEHVEGGREVKVPVVLSPESQRQMAAAEAKRNARADRRAARVARNLERKAKQAAEDRSLAEQLAGMLRYDGQATTPETDPTHEG